MAFSILLAHFCDKHGPRSIMCTQQATEAPEQLVLSDFSKESYCQACLLVFPKKDETAYSAVRFRQLNSIVRKCLSEETTVYDARPMYFADEVRGYSLSLSFKIKDLEARGSERRYAFIVNADKEQELLSHWDVVVEHITAIIDTLIERSTAFELKSATNNEMFLRGKLMQSRSLAELLGDDALFAKIHLWNARLLQKLQNSAS